MTDMKGFGRLKFALLLALVLYVSFTALFATSFSQGENNRNVSVDTQVNITQSRPEVFSVIVEGGATNITLNAGSTRTVTCNATARDFNGGSTLTANATFYATASATPFSADDNNTHYTNDSCAITGTDQDFRNFSCSFAVQYYADVGFWNCTYNVTDDFNFTDSLSNTTHIDRLLALNVTELIDFGDLAVGDTSSAEEANVTNLGNVNINVSVRGYARNELDNLSMVCEQGNISVEYEKFGILDSTDEGDFINLSSFNQLINFTIPQQTNDSAQETNTSYWLLVVPPNPFGLCNGTVVFEAQSST